MQVKELASTAMLMALCACTDSPSMESVGRATTHPELMRIEPAGDGGTPRLTRTGCFRQSIDCNRSCELKIPHRGPYCYENCEYELSQCKAAAEAD